MEEVLIISQLILYLAFYFLAYFVLPLARCFCFNFMENMTIGFAIDKAESKNANIAIEFSKQFL